MNKRQKKKFMNRRYEVVEYNRKVLINHHFEIGSIVKKTGITGTDGLNRRVAECLNSDGLSQWVDNYNLKRTYKKFK